MIGGAGRTFCPNNIGTEYVETLGLIHLWAKLHGDVAPFRP